MSGSLSLQWKQKLLLNLLIGLDSNKQSRLKIIKISFLLAQKIKFYDFVPYKYGPYSFEMDKDLRMFSNNRWIYMDEKSIYINHIAIKHLPIEITHKNEINDIANNFSNMNENNLLDFIYNNYPFYTQNSLLIKEHKKEEQSAEIAIYTIGYQNLTIDLFINTLIEKGIKTVIDVRNKPFSYKYGFNYSWLNKYLPEFKINYRNIPELGIEEKYRKTLSREELWKYYFTLLDNKEKSLYKLSNLITDRPSVLMCYEMNPYDCHRLRLARRLNKINNLQVVNFNTESKKWEKSEY